MLIVCPNIGVDHTVRLSALHPGTVQRTGPAASAAGGKGANVARAARGIGATPQVIGFLAARGGGHLRELFDAESIPLTGIEVPGEVRTCTVLIEDSGRVSLLNEPGAAVDEGQWQRLLDAVGPSPATVIGTGSLPPGAPVDGYARLVELVHSRGGECAVDTSTNALRLAAEAGADLVCPNLSEAAAVLDGTTSAVEQVDERAADVPDRAVQAARRLVALGAGQAAVTAGAAGVALVSADGAAWLPAVSVRARNPIGAGDSFLAGTMTARQRGRNWPRAVRYGMATAAASVEHPDAGVVDAARVRELDRALEDAAGGDQP